jgi:sugar (pentulose or hexulose) kinase
MIGMTSQDGLRASASALVAAANDFYRAADAPGSHTGAPEYLDDLQEALGAMSAAWYRLAADAVPRIREPRPARKAEELRRSRADELSLEQEVLLVGALHDVAAAFARCARACRDGQSTVTHVLVPNGHPATLAS